MGKLSKNKHLYNYFFHPEKINENKSDKFNIFYYKPKNNNSILDYKFIFTSRFDKFYIKAPELIKIDDNILNKIKNKVVNNKISLKEIDKILLNSTYSCSLSFHNMIKFNKEKIILLNNKNIKKQVSKIIINECTKDDQFPKFGKSTECTFNKIKTIVNNIFNFNLINGEIRKLCFFFTKNEIKQTKIMIKNFFKIQENKKIYYFPKLLIKHNKLSEMSETEIFILLKLVFDNFYSKKAKIKDYKNEYKILKKLLNENIIKLCYSNNIKSSKINLSIYYKN